MVPDLGRYELWGTFSVMDHMREGAFLAEVVMYDRLVVPVPPDPTRAQVSADAEFAQRQKKRWEDNGWDPDRQAKLLDIIGELAVPIEWNRERHELWAAEYEKSKTEAARQFAEILAGWKTGEMLLSEIPAKADGAVAVSPYESLEDLKRGLGITEKSTAEDRLRAGRGMPGDLVSVVVGREFLVPEDPERDEFDLLRRAVELVREREDFRLARKGFHAAQQQFICGGITDLESVGTAVDAMAASLAEMERITKRRRIWKGLRRAFFFGQTAAELATAPVNPVAAGHAAVNIARFTVNEALGGSGQARGIPFGGALLLDAQRELDLTVHGQRKPQRRLPSLRRLVGRGG